MDKSTALVFGGSGLVGNYLLQQLVSNNHFERVISVHRRSISVPEGVEQQIIDLDQIDAIDSLFVGAVVFVALGTTIGKAGSKEKFRYVDHDLVIDIGAAAAKYGASQLHVVSAIGSNPKSNVFYNRVKGEMEAALFKKALPSCYVYQPSILDGPRAEKRRGEKIGLVVAKLLRPILVGPLKIYRAVHAGQVAAAMINHSMHAVPGFHRVSSLEIQSTTF